MSCSSLRPSARGSAGPAITRWRCWARSRQAAPNRNRTNRSPKTASPRSNRDRPQKGAKNGRQAHGTTQRNEPPRVDYGLLQILHLRSRSRRELASASLRLHGDRLPALRSSAAVACAARCGCASRSPHDLAPDAATPRERVSARRGVLCRAATLGEVARLPHSSSNRSTRWHSGTHTISAALSSPSRSSSA